MPTPLGHTLTGALLYRIYKKKNASPPKKLWPMFLGLVFLSVIQDAENIFSWGLRIHVLHRTWLHTLLWTPLAGLVLGIVSRWWCASSFFRGFVWGCMAWMLHLALDMGASLTGPILFWPLDDTRYDWPVHIFPVAEPHIGSWFFNSVVLGFETAIFGGCLLAYMTRGKIKFAAILVVLLSFFGSARQCQYRQTFFANGSKAKTQWYKENLNRLTPWHFLTFSEAYYFGSENTETTGR